MAVSARWTLRVLVLAAGLVAAGYVLGSLWSVVLPVVLAVLLATLLWPPANALRRRGVPPSLASLVVLVLAALLLAVVLALVVPSLSGSVGQLAENLRIGVQNVLSWLSGPPLRVSQAQLDAGLTQLTTRLQGQASAIATGVINGVGSFASGIVTLLLTLVVAFFFVKDGPKFLPWVRTVAGAGAGGHLAEVLDRIWITVGSYVRQQILVALIDGVLIGLGLVILDVPLALALAVVSFLGGLVPTVGAIVSGALAVIVALVDNGLTTAIAVLILVVVVQQLEGNVLQPLLQARSLGLHAVVVLLAVVAGSALYGIVGAFLAVPVTAAVAVILRYIGEVIDGRPRPTVVSPDVVIPPGAETEPTP